MTLSTAIVMTAMLVAAGKGCGPDDSGNAGGGADAGAPVAVTGKVAGMATDSLGAPLASAQITICSTVFYNSCVSGKTDSGGRYALDLPSGDVWVAHASIIKVFNGKTYCLDLMPDSADSFSSQSGAVRNFQWKLSGPRPDSFDPHQSSSFYGANLHVLSDDYALGIRYQDVKLTLVPDGPLVDGTSGQTLTAAVGDWNSFVVGNIPLGPYRVSAEWAPPGGSHSPLLVGVSSGQYAASVVVDFDPDQGGVCGNPEATVHFAAPQ